MYLSPIKRHPRIMTPYTIQERALAKQIVDSIKDSTERRAEWRRVTKELIGSEGFPKKRESQHLNQLFRDRAEAQEGTRSPQELV